MNLTTQLHQEIEKWANHQGISFEEFILRAVAEKITTLNQQNTEVNSQISLTAHSSIFPESKIYRKEGILVIETEPINNLDFNTFIVELREERIQEQMAW